MRSDETQHREISAGRPRALELGREPGRNSSRKLPLLRHLCAHTQCPLGSSPKSGHRDKPSGYSLILSARAAAI